MQAFHKNPISNQNFEIIENRTIRAKKNQKNATGLIIDYKM